MQTTTPAQFIDLDAPIPYTLSPLARAALACGVDFDDVEAYASEPVPTSYREELTQDALDLALARSVLASGSIAHARLWWLGVLES